jgi:hypothetical protein
MNNKEKWAQRDSKAKTLCILFSLLKRNLSIPSPARTCPAKAGNGMVDTCEQKKTGALHATPLQDNG